VVNRPFGSIVAINDYANVLLGLSLIFPIGLMSEQSLVYGFLAADSSLLVWPILVIISAVMTRIGFWTDNKHLASWGAMISAVSWLFLFIVYAQSGSVIPGMPFIIRPIVIAIFTKLKIALDKEWFSK
jgi:hypothetical protein